MTPVYKVLLENHNIYILDLKDGSKDKVTFSQLNVLRNIFEIEGALSVLNKTADAKSKLLGVDVKHYGSMGYIPPIKDISVIGHISPITSL